MLLESMVHTHTSPKGVNTRKEIVQTSFFPPRNQCIYLFDQFSHIDMGTLNESREVLKHPFGKYCQQESDDNLVHHD